MTAISGTFSDFKIIRGRKVAQLVIEVPLEQADAALKALGGVPQAQNERWVGIAPLTEEAATRNKVASAPPDLATSEKPRKRFSEMSRAQQAGMLCQDERFQNWIIGAFGKPPDSEEWQRAEWVARVVRDECAVISRAQLDSSDDAGEIWDRLVTEYDAWRGKIARPESAA